MSGGEMSGGKFPRHPWDWYVEPKWTVAVLYNQLTKHCRFGAFEDHAGYGGSLGHRIYDPACGRGTIPMFFKSIGYTTTEGDIIDRRADECVGILPFYYGDFLGKGTIRQTSHWSGVQSNPPLSIVCNPPYSWQDGQLVRGLAQGFVERALQVANRKVCMLLPLKWLAGEARGEFLNAHPPRFIFVLNRRPSMPPGDMIAHLGAKAFKRGRIDYCWVVWDHAVETLPGETKTIFVTADECQGEAM